MNSSQRQPTDFSDVKSKVEGERGFIRVKSDKNVRETKQKNKGIRIRKWRKSSNKRKQSI